MGFFDIDEKTLQARYKRAWHESKDTVLDPRKVDYLDRSLMQYARENKCSYTEALRIAKKIK